jgi:hypothetical protein
MQQIVLVIVVNLLGNQFGWQLSSPQGDYRPRSRLVTEVGTRITRILRIGADLF